MRQPVRRKVESAEVVVVGAGPAGLTAAIALARAGVETLLIEQRDRPSGTARATTISMASMELMRAWGLDTYAAERRPIAEHNVARSSRPNGSEADVVLETQRDLGGRIAHVWQATAAGRVSTLDLLGDGLTLFTGPDGAAWRTAAGSMPARVPLTRNRLDAITARALGVSGRGALLVRPDGRPAALWTGDDGAASALRAAVESATALNGTRAPA